MAPASALHRHGREHAQALEELVAGGHWALVGRKGEQAAGNGAAMRIAPLALFCDPGDPDARRAIRDVCRITHHNDEAYAGALAVIMAIRAVVAGRWSRGAGLLELVVGGLPDTAVRDRLAALTRSRGLPLHELATRFGNSGYVVESIPLALAAAEHITSGFERVLTELVSCGGDTDTIAAIAGQIMGAALGDSGLPTTWLERLQHEQLLIAIARHFAEHVGPESRFA